MKNGIYFVFVLLILSSCSSKTIKINNLSGTELGAHSTEDLKKYLGVLYPDIKFEISSDSENADIQLLLSDQMDAIPINQESVPTVAESFKILDIEERLFITAPDEIGLRNATYALLEKLGYGFYISGDVPPNSREWNGFKDWAFDDEPLMANRFLFNWHNFLSGCTGWSLEEWKSWIDQGNKMRYNGIMVHAYGNNPMFSFEYLGEKKKTGYLNNSRSGRDWGNQHVNDVRRLVGGEIFEFPVFGSDASKASEENKEMEATKLMQQTFSYAEQQGTKITFALDFDTWMANPENIIKKLPADAIFELGGHVAVNPDHPEGYKYYENLLKTLLNTYPEIDQLAVWHRRPSAKSKSGTIWMNFPFIKFSVDWKKDYISLMKQNPEIEDNLQANSMFAFGKLIGALQKARDVLKPELEISSGSWGFDFVQLADAFYPKDVPLIPLDWGMTFDEVETKDILAKAGKNRDIYPVIWAHHDDHRYIGRPYTPFENLNTLLQEKNAKGFGIIHWTTRPLDLYFTNSIKQVWKSTENESLKSTIKSYSNNVFNEDNEKLDDYFQDWMTTGPMFGRETSDHFIDIGMQHEGDKLESWGIMNAKAQERYKALSEISSLTNNENFRYQKAMEQFYISFAENQELFQKSYGLLELGDTSGAIEVLKRANPNATLEKYVAAINYLDFTSGEKAILISMNTRWKTDFLNLGQRLGIEPTRYKFSPTQHDSLAQFPGSYTYFIDDDQAWWRCLWQNELEKENFVEDDNRIGLMVEDEFIFILRTMHNQMLPKGKFKVEIDTERTSSLIVSVIENGSVVTTNNIAGQKSQPVLFDRQEGELQIKIIVSKPTQILSIKISPVL